uniref:Major facilitator superfamily (MFS) profile domain-containing protein n=1 Tax=Panagrolaimus davidi TaxID=227884 RepID=A0A914NYM3_9BILA
MSPLSVPPPPKTKVPIFALKSTRLRIALLLMLGLFCATSMRVNLGMAVVCMVNQTAFERPSEFSNLTNEYTENHQKCMKSHTSLESLAEGYDGTLLWSPKQIALLLSATFYGSLLTIWWSGYLADTFGPKMVLLTGVLDCVVVALLTPMLATTSFYAIFIARLIMGLGEGFVFPSMSSMAARWFPPSERSTFAAIYTSGNQVAGVLGILISSYLCGTDFLGGWPSIFYLFGFLGCCWTVAWLIFASNLPERNSFITEEEILYIKQQTAGQNTNQKEGSRKLSTIPIPWKFIAASTPFYANLIAQFSFNFSASLLQSFLPTYIKQVLKVELGKNGIYTMLPFLTQLISKNIYGILSDSLKRHGVLSNTAAVKIFQFVGNVGAGLCFLVLGLFVDCTTIPLAITALAFYGIFFSAGICGFYTSQLSIAPAFTGTMISISMLSGTFGNAASPGVVGIINKYGSEKEWTFIWLITAGVNFVAAAVYVVFGSADIQEWALPPREFPPDSPIKTGSKQFESFPIPQPIAIAFDNVEIEIVGEEKKDEIGREFKPAPPMRQRSRKISDVSAQDFS